MLRTCLPRYRHFCVLDVLNYYPFTPHSSVRFPIILVFYFVCPMEAMVAV